MTEQEKPFMACLWHESKAAGKMYIKIIVGFFACIFALMAFCWLVITFGSAAATGTGNVVTFIISASNIVRDSIFWTLLAIPWYVYAFAIIVSPPILYALMKCLERHYKIDTFAVALAWGFIIMLSLFAGVASSMFHKGLPFLASVITSIALAHRFFLTQHNGKYSWIVYDEVEV
jgi:hypothetical protein